MKDQSIAIFCKIKSAEMLLSFIFCISNRDFRAWQRRVSIINIYMNVCVGIINIHILESVNGCHLPK